MVLLGAAVTTRITSKGQVTIPKNVRDRLGLAAGSEVEFELDAEGRAFLVPSRPTAQRSRFEALLGRADAGLSTDEIMALTRGDGE